MCESSGGCSVAVIPTGCPKGEIGVAACVNKIVVYEENIESKGGLSEEVPNWRNAFRS